MAPICYGTYELLKTLGEYVLAAEELEKATSIRGICFGEEHIESAICLFGLAEMHTIQGATMSTISCMVFTVFVP